MKADEIASLRILDERLPSHRLWQERVTTHDGRAWRLFFAVPHGPAPESGWPLLELLDGTAAFDVLTGADLARVPRLAVAGIGYDTPMRFDRAARGCDFTPPRSPSDPSRDPARPDRMVGGGDRFLDALTGSLRERIDAGLLVDTARRSLWGHSLAGLLGCYVALSRPDAYAQIVAASPSLWWGESWLLHYEQAIAMERRLPSLHLILGDAERRSSPDGPHWEGPQPQILEFAARLRKRGLAVDPVILPGLGHAATLGASLPGALARAASVRSDHTFAAGETLSQQDS